MLEFASLEFLEELTLRYHARPSFLNRFLPEAIFPLMICIWHGALLGLNMCGYVLLSPKDIDRSILQRKP